MRNLGWYRKCSLLLIFFFFFLIAGEKNSTLWIYHNYSRKLPFTKRGDRYLPIFPDYKQQCSKSILVFLCEHLWLLFKDKFLEIMCAHFTTFCTCCQIVLQKDHTNLVSEQYMRALIANIVYYSFLILGNCYFNLHFFDYY